MIYPSFIDESKREAREIASVHQGEGEGEGEGELTGGDIARVSLLDQMIPELSHGASHKASSTSRVRAMSRAKALCHCGYGTPEVDL
jgi:hypothetical protein